LTQQSGQIRLLDIQIEQAKAAGDKEALKAL